MPSSNEYFFSFGNEFDSIRFTISLNLHYLADFAAAYLLKLKATEKEVSSSHRSHSQNEPEKEEDDSN